MAKISKSIRLSEDVFEYINSQPGDDFTDKFERLIREVREGESARRKKLLEYDRRLEACSSQLSRARRDLGALDEVIRKLGWVSSNVQCLADTTERVLQETAGAPAGAAKM